MSWLGAIEHVAKKIVHRSGDDHRTQQRTSTACTSDGFEPARARPTTTWWAGRPLSEAKNQHRTNTKEQFAEGLKSGANWFEGDIRKELHSDRIEMRHDETAECGDNQTLQEWLQKGKATGRGLKLDVKEGEHMPEIMREVNAANIPSERLMFNLGDAELDKYGAQIRKDHPNAIFAINTRTDGDKVSQGEIDRMLAHAKKLGQPVTFEIRHDRLTDDAIRQLKGHGTISVWGHADDVTGTERSLKRCGVDGMIDVEQNPSTMDKIGAGLDRAKNVAGEFLGGL
jgi:hypothetical protein